MTCICSHLENLALSLDVRNGLWAPEKGRELGGLEEGGCCIIWMANRMPWDKLGYSVLAVLGQVEVWFLSSSCCHRCGSRGGGGEAGVQRTRVRALPGTCLLPFLAVSNRKSREGAQLSKGRYGVWGW